MPSTARGKTMDIAASNVAKQFLQSVVVIDDQATLGAVAPASGAIARAAPDVDSPAGAPSREPHSRSRVARRELRVPTSELLSSTVPDQALDAKALVDGFAEHGIVCGVIRPGADENPVQRTVNAAQRADIVVLDWELYNDNGDTTIQIIKELLRGNTNNGDSQLRLIAIYSGTLDLRRIASAVRTAMANTTPPVRFTRDGDYGLVSGLVRLVVFSKPTTRLASGGKAFSAMRRRIVQPADLPDQLIGEFARLTTGIVPNVALASISALRKNTHRVLARLQADLDPAYLWHRSTQIRPADAEEHLVELVTGELHSVLEDARVGEWANMDAIRRWIAHDGRSDYASSFGEKSPRSPADLEELLAVGAAGSGDGNRDVRKKFSQMCVENKAHRKKIPAFAKSTAASTRANEKLAALMSLRTRYENPPPRLELGTILSRGRGKARKYWICVQPRCDSVRLRGDAAFPLLPLNIIDGDEKIFDVLLPNSKGFLRLRVSKKPRDLQVPVFAIHPPGGDMVLAVRRGSGFAFITRSKHRYDWVAELKPEHAQRIAHSVANEFSRVGLSESEWMRLWAR